VRQKIEWTGGRADLAGSDPQIAGSGRQAAVAEQQLNGPYIGARFQQMNRKSVSSKCGVIGLRIPESLRAFLQASSTADVLMGLSGKSPGKSQCRGLLTRHSA